MSDQLFRYTFPNQLSIDTQNIRQHINLSCIWGQSRQSNNNLYLVGYLILNNSTSQWATYSTKQPEATCYRHALAYL